MEEAMIDLRQGDCLELMRAIPDGSVDMVLTDPPYGTTACKWDSVIPFAPMWEQLKRVIKPNGAIVLTASQPFTSALVMSNLDWFRYEWVWNKKQSGSFMTAKLQPLKITESVLVFSAGKCPYNPLMRKGKLRKKGGAKTSMLYGATPSKISDDYFPTNLIEISNAFKGGRTHPTQKPVALMEYLIHTYSNEGETVLDFTMGSGTTGVACRNLNRNFIGMELDANYFEIAKKRIEETKA
jgi:site-specific DNA-methyltransferase (adenine-specific)